jgi:hypothetical protein
MPPISALVLLLHSIVRWIVLALGMTAVYRTFKGRSDPRPWASSDIAAAIGFIGALDIQLAIGVLLYLYSPITILGVHELDLTMRSRALRFWTFEHPLLMLTAIVLAHVGGLRMRRTTQPPARRKVAAVYFGTALVLLVAGIPWPFLTYGRPLLSMFKRL